MLTCGRGYDPKIIRVSSSESIRGEHLAVDPLSRLEGQSFSTGVDRRIAYKRSRSRDIEPESTIARSRTEDADVSTCLTGKPAQISAAVDAYRKSV